jgi:hypothetical protein
MLVAQQHIHLWSFVKHPFLSDSSSSSHMAFTMCVLSLQMLLAKEGFESVKGPCGMGTAGSDRQEGVCSRDEEDSREVHHFLKITTCSAQFC